MADLVIRDKTTGQAKVFTPTAQGYAEAEAFQKIILEKGHSVGDDNTNSLERINSFLSK